MDRVDECLDHCNKERPLSLPLFFALGSKCDCVCSKKCVRHPGTSAVTIHWDENEGRQLGNSGENRKVASADSIQSM